MVNSVRVLVALFVAFAVLASATSQPATALTKAVAMADMPCCDGDDPESPSCDIACMMLVRCASASNGLLPHTWLALADSMQQAVLTAPDPPLTVTGRHPEGLKRPPRV